MALGELTHTGIGAAVDRILSSPGLARAPKLAKLLRVLVEESLEPNRDSPKEHELGVRAFDRPTGYDPQSDPIVRVQARQLRLKLHEYYETTGKDDAVRIMLLKGSYALEITSRARANPEAVVAPSPDEPVSSRAPERGSRFRSSFLLVGFLAAAVICAGVWLFLHRRSAGSVAERKVSPAAQELYLKGRFYWNKRTPEDLRTALDLFTQAVVREPGYAQAYVGMADTYSLLREYAGMPAADAWPRATEAARKAVKFDDSLAEAHASLAFSLFYGSLDLENGLREFRRAVELNPRYATAHHWYSGALGGLGRFAEAKSELEKAQQLDPGSRSILADKGMLLFCTGAVSEAIALLKEITSADPGFRSAHSYLARIYLSQHDGPSYLREARAAARLEGNTVELSALDDQQKSFDRGGEHRLLQSLLQSRLALYEQGRGEAFPVAEIYARLGSTQNAIHFLEISYSRKEFWMASATVNDAFASLHGDPAFQALVDKMSRRP